MDWDPIMDPQENPHIFMIMVFQVGQPPTRYHRIGLRENLQENPMIFMGKSMVSCRFSLKPIH